MLASLILSLALVHPQAVAVQVEQNPLLISPEIKQFLDKKVDRNLPPMERLQALVAAVFQDSELKFTYSPESRTAIQTFENRSGNCLSFTFLFIAMARHLNLDARFREVEVPPLFSKSGLFVNLSQHLNAAVFIGGQAYAIDVFPGVNPIEIGGQVVSDERGLAHFYNNMGVDELTKGNFGQADVFFQKALKTDPSAVCIWINLGAARSQAGQYPEAEKYLRKALELEPNNPAAMSNLANVCELMGRTREAQRLQAKVREFRDKNPYHHYNLGLKAFEEGRYQDAIVHYKRAVKLKSAEHNFYFALARAFAQLGQNDEVMSNLRLAEKYASDPANKQRYAQKLELLKGIRTSGIQHPG